jgi:hypothetical protein
LAYQFNAPIFERPSAGAAVVGFVRRSGRVAVLQWVKGPGCRGSWYEIHGGGYACNTEGFAIGRDPRLEASLRTPAPEVDATLPFRYAKVKRGAPRFWGLPTVAEEKAALATTGVSSGVQERLDGDYFVAIAGFEADGEREFARTVRGRYVRADDVELRTEPRMHGEHLGAGETLPIAFVHVDVAPVFSLRDESLIEAGVAEKHARFSVASIDTVQGRRLVVSADGLALPRKAVRVAEVVSPPHDVPAESKWIHVDLEQQTLVAYEGERPVFATLVSTGKPGHEPPRGVFRVHKKYVSRTMSGEDDVDGVYEVDQVPWTMYYWGSYALHGAYWHDDFGTVRSHGCTNIAPLDARWLFYWSPPELPEGWHGTVGRKGPWVYFT